MTIDGGPPLAQSDPLSALAKSGCPIMLRDAWDARAKEWIDWVRAPGQPDSYWRFHRKRFLPLVPPPGQLTLDIGCGEGRISRDLQERRHNVLGVDWSFTMCQAATTHWENRCWFIVGDAAKLPLADASVDCAVAFMSLQDIDDLPGAVKEIARVLADGRKLALAIVHPMYSGGTFSPAGEIPDGNFVIQRSYFKPELRISSDSEDSLTVTFYRQHRPLQAYVHALLEAGFSIDQLHELTDEDEGKPLHRVPMFLDIVATRQPRQKLTNAADQPESAQHIAAHPPRRNVGYRRPRARKPAGRELEHVSLRRKVLDVYVTVPPGLSGVLHVAVAAMAWLALAHLNVQRIPGPYVPGLRPTRRSLCVG